MPGDVGEHSTFVEIETRPRTAARYGNFDIILGPFHRGSNPTPYTVRAPWSLVVHAAWELLNVKKEIVFEFLENIGMFHSLSRSYPT